MDARIVSLGRHLNICTYRPPPVAGFGLVPRSMQQKQQQQRSAVAAPGAVAPVAAAVAAPASVDDKVNDFLASLSGL